MANQEIVFNSPTSDEAWIVTVDENGKQIRQDPPGQIPPNAYASVKGGGSVNLIEMTYGQFKSADNDMSILSADGTADVGEYTPGADPVQDLAFIAQQIEANENVNGKSQTNSSYGPNGIYDPAKPVKVDVEGDIITGAEGRPIRVNSTQAIPQGELTAVGIYGAPGTNIQELSREAAIAISRNDNVTPQQINGVYGNAVRYAAAKDISVQQALRDMISMGMAGGGGTGGGGGGGGGPFSSTSTTITQTDELEAERILNSALSTYLGRRADADEVAEFMKKLNQNEKFNPTVTKTTGVRSGNNTTQQSTQTGGFDSTGFAERWARSREGAAEYQAATTYMDAFQSVIDGMEY